MTFPVDVPHAILTGYLDAGHGDERCPESVDRQGKDLSTCGLI